MFAGCGQQGPAQHREAPRGPLALQKASPRPAAGTHRVTCPIESDHGKVRLALDLPRGFVRGVPDSYSKRGGCAWYRPVKVPDDGNFDGDPTTRDSFESNVILHVGAVGKHDSVDAYYDENEPDAVEGDNPDGDDSILHLERIEDVPVFGATIGERLSYLCFCDGQNTLHRFAQADGILLGWDSELPLQKQTDRQLRAVLASIGTVD
jgi:hypothetical protein